MTLQCRVSRRFLTLPDVTDGKSMSDHNEDHQHESPIKTPKQLITLVVLAFVVPVIVIILIATFVASGDRPGAGSNWSAPEQVAARIAPVAKFELKDVNAPKVLQTGEQVFKAICATCHATGAAGAPKIGDNAAWGPRIGQGYELLLKHAIEGLRAMPPKGGNPDLDDVEVARAMVYMANGSGGKLPEPAAPAAGGDAGKDAAKAEPAKKP